MINTHFWTNKKVLITGHTGFKGSWLSLWLKSLGVEVSGIALEPDNDTCLFNILKLNNSVNHHVIDIRNKEKLTSTIKKINPEIIIHLAAQPLVRESYNNPIETLETNIIGTANVLEASRCLNNIKVILNVTTDKCYENQNWVWPYRETDRLGGHDPYSNSKACSELVTQSYRDSFLKGMNIAVATARSGNVLGGGDWSKDRIIPDIIEHTFNQKTLSIRNPLSTRPWQHVLEPLRGYLYLIEKLWSNPSKYDGSWNFGPQLEDTKTVISIVENMNKLSGGSLKWKTSNNLGPHESEKLMLDISKSSDKLKWQPKWRLHEALEHTYDWYKTWQNNNDMLLYTEKEINSYMNEFICSKNLSTAECI